MTYDVSLPPGVISCSVWFLVGVVFRFIPDIQSYTLSTYIISVREFIHRSKIILHLTNVCTIYCNMFVVMSVVSQCLFICLVLSINIVYSRTNTGWNVSPAPAKHNLRRASLCGLGFPQIQSTQV